MWNERGNASLLMLGISFGILLCAMLVWLFISAQLTHGAASAAADAGALAASHALQEAFVSDISPEAYGKLDLLVKNITEDPLYKKGETEAAIVKYTVPSKLRDELFLGNRGRAIELYVLLQYEPFFTEQDLGRKISLSFQRHMDAKILPEVKRYLLRNGAAATGEIAFPIHEKIEILAKKDYKSPVFSKLIGEHLRYVSGRGHALYIKILDEHHIPYDISGVPVYRRQL